MSPSCSQPRSPTATKTAGASRANSWRALTPLDSLALTPSATQARRSIGDSAARVKRRQLEGVDRDLVAVADAAFQAWTYERRSELASRELLEVRRPRNTRSRRYVSRQIALGARAAADDRDEAQRLDVLRRIFNGDLPPQAENALDVIREMRLEGRVLRIRLEALRERYRLTVLDESDAARTLESEVIWIVCSDGLVE